MDGVGTTCFIGEKTFISWDCEAVGETDTLVIDLADTPLAVAHIPTKATKKTDVPDAVDRNLFMLKSPFKLHILQILYFHTRHCKRQRKRVFY